MAGKNSVPKAAAPSKFIPQAPKLEEDRRWTFSFRYWNQAENFGLNNNKVDVAWFISLLERLKDLSREKIEEAVEDHTKSDSLRLHLIDWGAKNMPITKAEFEKIVPPKLIPEESDVCQFQISKGTGRVIGFFDHEHTFQIVFLDSVHNMQPSSYNDYAINPTKVALSEIENHRERLIKLKKQADEQCRGESCSLKDIFTEVMETKPGHRFFCLNEYLDEDVLTKLARRHGSIENIVFQAMLLLEADAEAGPN